MKITRRQLRRIIKEELEGLRESMSYRDSMVRVDQILGAIDQGGFADDAHVTDLLDIVGDDGSFETDEARGAIMALQDRDGGTTTGDAESYIRDALRAQGR